MAETPPPPDKPVKGRNACPTCSGTGKIVDTKGVEHTCGVCHGSKTK